MYIVSFFIQAYKLGINIWAFEFAKDLASPALTSIMAIIGKSFLVVIPFLVLYLYFIKKDANVYTFIVAGVLFYVVSDAIKLITKEPRPCNVTELSWINNVACESSYSFPSNHASVLTGLTFFLGKYRYLQIAYVIWLIMVLFGRVYLGLHYFTDVIAGIALSLAMYYVISKYKNRINKLLNNIVKRVLPKLALKV